MVRTFKLISTDRHKLAPKEYAVMVDGEEIGRVKQNPYGPDWYCEETGEYYPTRKEAATALTPTDSQAHAEGG